MLLSIIGRTDLERLDDIHPRNDCDINMAIDMDIVVSDKEMMEKEFQNEAHDGQSRFTRISVASSISNETVLDQELDEAIENPAAIQKVWEEELYNMKPSERETSTNELHGVEFNNAAALLETSDGQPGISKEDPQMIATALREIQEVIDKLVSTSSPDAMDADDGRKPLCYGYRRSLELKSTYIRTPAVRLKFLRADRFDIQKAAERYISCLDLLYDAFGDKIFYRQLYLSDLGCLSQKLLRDGNFQLLPSRDRTGRRVVVVVGKPDCKTEEEIEASFRSMLYLLWSVLSEDLTTQIKGGVVLLFPLNSPPVTKEDAKLMTKLITTLPIRYTGIHFCIPNKPLFRVLKALCLATIGAERRRICRFHTGSPIEVDYILSTYGIIVKDIPRTYSFMIKTKNWNRFLKVRAAIDDHRKKIEAAKPAGNLVRVLNNIGGPCGIECPEVNCILFGNKAMAWDHPGNIEFRDIIEEKEFERDCQSHSKSNSIYKGDRYNDYIIEEARSRNFVFMEYDKDNAWYTEINDDALIRHKITQLLTGIRKRRKAARLALKARMGLRREAPLGTVIDEEAKEASRSNFMCNFEKKNNSGT